MKNIDLERFLSKHMRQGDRYVAARLQAALALLERLRDTPELRLDAHKKPSSSGLDSHETFGNRAHAKLGLGIINKNHGRRSSNVGGWGQDLLDRLNDAGFAGLAPAGRGEIIDATQAQFGELIRSILDDEPIRVRLKGRTAESVIRDVLKQAEAKGKAGDVAQYLVGAKLMLRFNREIPVVASNKGDRKSRSDENARGGDFEIENAVIEVAVGTPDEKHLAQIADALYDNEIEVWLLTRHDRVTAWQNEVDKYDVESIDAQRVVVTAIETFVGQNITELGEFSAKKRNSQLQQLFNLYNERWISRVGSPGIRIVPK